MKDKTEYSANEFKKFVETKSNGRIQVKTFPGSQLGGEREVMEGVQMGTIEMGSLATGAFAVIYKDIMVFDLPYLFPSYEVAYKILDGPIGQEMIADINKKTGVKAFYFGENGYRNFTNSKRAVKTVADFKGLKIRTIENPAHMALVRALGGNPTPMAFSEVYTALSQKAIDGQNNPIGVILAAKLNEVQKYLTVDNHIYNPMILVMNGKFYAAMNAADRKIVDEGAKLWLKTIRDFQRKQTEDAIEVLKQSGMQVDILTPSEIKPFKEATRSVYEDWGKKNINPQLISKVVKAVDETEKALAAEQKGKAPKGKKGKM